jgi:antitoxin PrlF
MTATLTSKGQVTIPKALREQLGLEAGDRLEFVLREDGKVELVPLDASIAALKGIVKVTRAATTEEMNEAVAAAASGDIDWD